MGPHVYRERERERERARGGRERERERVCVCVFESTSRGRAAFGCGLDDRGVRLPSTWAGEKDTAVQRLQYDP